MKTQTSDFQIKARLACTDFLCSTHPTRARWRRLYRHVRNTTAVLRDSRGDILAVLKDGYRIWI